MAEEQPFSKRHGYAGAEAEITIREDAPESLRYWVRRAAAKVVGSCAQNAIVLSPDRKSTRLNSSHLVISYAVFCLKKNKLAWSLYHLLLRQQYTNTYTHTLYTYLCSAVSNSINLFFFF